MCGRRGWLEALDSLGGRCSEHRGQSGTTRRNPRHLAALGGDVDKLSVRQLREFARVAGLTPRELVALVGSVGTGKSTIVRHYCDQRRQTDGVTGSGARFLDARRCANVWLLPFSSSELLHHEQLQSSSWPHAGKVGELMSAAARFREVRRRRSNSASLLVAVIHGPKNKGQILGDVPIVFGSWFTLVSPLSFWLRARSSIPTELYRCSG
mgnify:CR=1 FL=1